MKTISIISTLLIGWLFCYPQENPKNEDFGRIILNTHVPAQLQIPEEAKKLLETKLTQIATSSGMGGSTVNPRFIITASINIGTKDIIAGPPQMIAQNLEVTLYIGDALDNKIYSNKTIPLKGVGSNENKSFIDAIKKINPNHKEIAAFIEESKNKIISYYTDQCDATLQAINTLKNQGKYDEAIYKLSVVPEACQDCYFKCLDLMEVIYKEKINSDCKTKLKEAQSIWSADLSKQGAESALKVLSLISPQADCQSEISSFIKSVETKLKADEKAQWEFAMKQYADNVARDKELLRMKEEQAKRNFELNKENLKYQENQSQRNFELDKFRVGAFRDVALEYAKINLKALSYSNLYWH